ncbi:MULTISPECIES: DUF2065 domain-containing protein [Hydrocarboniphaga]|jgi:uncharacterized protein YjeT (DUF2065 family)|uniref:DUF2065 domain-containing protein n=1 Tax=Hydrocarboniphaga effusa AP103 TaxID=1172194 RepID=I7Z8S2_9GAMM|nr:MULTISPECIES: DUF2065 domain-containing protein [Hydrocarboniphaga]EIT68229.1 hypothetical protein WQQ_46640 [Hydrocarboniphaga effusa AP103]MDZ4079594.1 DUF2065 domain-containing protein [Hydrocarboniphaga sp.]
MWIDIVQALALLLILEGIMPFLSPRRFRQSLLNFASLEDKWMRLLALISMVAGLILLQIIGADIVPK